MIEAAGNAGEKSFVAAFQAAIMGPKPAWFGNLPADVQAPLSQMQASLETLKAETIENERSGNQGGSDEARSTAAGEVSSLIGTALPTPQPSAGPGGGTTTRAGSEFTQSANAAVAKQINRAPARVGFLMGLLMWVLG